jgi:D-glycero-alpha-D-manno-heptose-7-phosphate kinase
MTLSPLYFINSSAPTRICDNGGWTDTWFAEYGSVFNIAIEPRCDVQIAVCPRDALDAQIVISAANFNDAYSRDPGDPWQKHPLIEAAIDHIGVPDDLSIFVHLYSAAPPGASLGTSAAMTVALLGALDCLTPGRLTAHEVAYSAQQVETVKLGWQCGIQDQLAAAYGGICYIDMFQYPYANVSPVQPDEVTRWNLQRRLLVIYLGKPHRSSLVHERVIAVLEDSGAEDPRLAALRRTAAPARDALLAGDFAALGQSFIENTEGQRTLNPDLISPEAQQIIELAQSHEALGWKVNGAGGPGGSVALLLDGSIPNRHRLMQAISASDSCQVIIPRLAQQGLRAYIGDP